MKPFDAKCGQCGEIVGADFMNHKCKVDFCTSQMPCSVSIPVELLEDVRYVFQRLAHFYLLKTEFPKDSTYDKEKEWFDDLEKKMDKVLKQNT